MKVGVIGAGMAGLACADGLKEAGHDVVLFDKGRGAGGRMASRRLTTPLGEVTFDHGAQYFTARDPDFIRQVERWAAAGIVDLWTGGGENAWVGTPAMNVPLKAMARGQQVHWSTRVTELVRTATGWSIVFEGGRPLEVDAVVVAIPAEQAAELLGPIAPEVAATARAIRSRPCWTVMLAFDRRLSCAVDRIHGADGSPLGWAARNNARPGRPEIEAWVVQAGADWSDRHLERPASDVSDLMARALAAAIDAPLPAVIGQAAHRWLYARSGAGGQVAVWEARLGLGVCGDWLIAPRVEAAWMSGRRLATRMRGTDASGQ